MSLQDGYLRAPSRIYFSGGNYTVTAWVKLLSFNHMSRLFDFGNGVNNDNIVFGLSHLTSGKPYHTFYKGRILKYILFNKLRD